MLNKKMSLFVKKVKKKFDKYFVGFGVKKQKNGQSINIIIDDKDISKMKKEEVYKKTQKVLNELNSVKEIKPKVVLVSDINNKNFVNILGDYSQIMDVKSMTAYTNMNLPEGFWDIYEELPNEFKLEDLRKSYEKKTKKEHHRNTYQNWLKSLKISGFVKLKAKTYQKISNKYKKSLIKIFQ